MPPKLHRWHPSRLAPLAPQGEDNNLSLVMPALVAGIHVLSAREQVVDGRDKPGDDA